MITLNPNVSSTKDHYVTGNTAHLKSSSLLTRYFQEHGALGGLHALKDAFLAIGRYLPFSAEGLVAKGIRFALNLNVFPGVGMIPDTSPPSTESKSFVDEFKKGTKEDALTNLKWAALLSLQTGRYKNIPDVLSSKHLSETLSSTYHKSILENDDLRVAIEEVSSDKNKKLNCQWDWQPLTACEDWAQKNIEWQGLHDTHADLFSRLPKEIAQQLKKNHGVWNDENTGNSIRLFIDKSSVKNGKPVIVMRHAPLGGDFKPEQRQGANAQMAGMVPPSVEQTIAFGKMVRTALGDKYEVLSVGLCRGGMMAQAEALANGGKAICFNSLPMGAGVRSRVGVLMNQGNAKDQIKHISIENDWVTDKKPLNKLAIAFERLTGIGVPRNAGDGFRFPNARIFHDEWDRDPIHMLPFVSMCGFVADKTERTEVMKSADE